MTRVVPWIALLVLSGLAVPLAAQTSPPPVWGPPLVADLVGLGDGWEAPADISMHTFNRLQVTGTPGMWVYAAGWVSVPMPCPSNESGTAMFQQLIAKFPFLAPRDPSDLNVELATALSQNGYQDTPLELPDCLVEPVLQTALGTTPLDPNFLKRAWQPICPTTSYTGAPDPNLQPVTRLWNCNTAVWQAQPSYPTTLNTWWKAAADYPALDPANQDATIIDFDVLAQKTLIDQALLFPPAQGESIDSFFTSGPDPSSDPIITWYTHARKLFLKIDIQFLGLITGSTNHVFSISEVETGGLTGIGQPETAPRIAWSDKLSVTFYVPRPELLTTEDMFMNLITSPVIQAGNKLKLPLRSVVPPVSIRMRDSSNVVHVSRLDWMGVGLWGLTLPAGFPTGNFTILNVATQYHWLSGAGQPWSTVNYQVPQFP